MEDPYILIKQAVSKGAILFASVSGGKDGQAMSKVLPYKIEGLVHADLGSVEWPQSVGMCEKLAVELQVPLHVITRSDKRGLLEHWEDRMNKLQGSGKPFWSSSKNRYCTSDLKRDPINKFFRNCGHDFIISCEGIRAEESTARSKKQPLAIRKKITSTYYDGMTVEQAIGNYRPGYRLALDFYPIFNFTLSDVWSTYGMTDNHLTLAQKEYRLNKVVPEWWPFHPAYAYGNKRVSCMFCILGAANDLQVAAQHNPELLDKMIALEEKGNATFKDKWSLKNLKVV